MRFVGIDVGSRTHVIAIVSETGEVLLKPTPFGEDAVGYEKLFGLVASPAETFVAMEATGHYGRNLFSALCESGYQVAVINPLRTRRFAEEDLARAKNDSIDALGIARFAAQKRPAAALALDAACVDLRERVRFHDRLGQDYSDRVRQLHRLVHLGFPEFTRHVRGLDSRRAIAILEQYPTARAFDETCLPSLAALRYDGHHVVGQLLARTLVEAAQNSVGRHHAAVYRAQTLHFCQDIETLRGRLNELEAQIEAKLAEHPVASLLSTIDGLGSLSVARIIAAVGDPARFRHGAALASYVGVPGTNHSGLRRPSHASLSPLGNARLRRALYMATLGAVRWNPWLRAYYQRLRANGKLPKVALCAAMRKLLMAVYSVAKHKQPFVPRPITDSR